MVLSVIVLIVIGMLLGHRTFYRYGLSRNSCNSYANTRRIRINFSKSSRTWTHSRFRYKRRCNRHSPCAYICRRINRLSWMAVVYLTSATLILFVTVLLYRNLPTLGQSRMTTMPYRKLIRSVLLLFIEERLLRIRGILALLIFTSFSILWTSLVLPLSATPHNLSHTAIGAFGLAGVAGALAATKAGQLADKGLGQRTTGIALSLLVLSWLLIKSINHSLLLLIFGIILLDLAVQAVHVTNQSMLFTVRPEARSRLTASYMIFYSIGSATGAILSTNTYAKYGWDGVCILGVSISACALLFWIITLRRSSQLNEE